MNTARLWGVNRRSFRGRLAAIALFGFIVRITYAMVWVRHRPLAFDASSYYELSKGITHHFRYESSDRAHLLTALFPPGYPAFLALGRLLGFATRTKLLWFVAALGTATVAMIGTLAKRIGGETVGLTAAVLAAIYPNLWLADGAMMTESLTAALVVGALIVVIRLRTRLRVVDGCVLGAVLSWMCLTRTDGFLVALALAGFVIVRSARSSATRTTRIATVAAVILVPMLVVGGWQLRNQSEFHRFVPIAVNGWDVVAGANCPSTYYGDRIGTWELPCVKVVEAFMQHGFRGEIDQNEYARKIGYRYAAGHLDRLATVVAPARIGRTLGVIQPLRELEIEAFFEGRSVAWSKLGYGMYLVLVGAAIVAMLRRRIALAGYGMLCAIPFVAVLVSTAFGYGNQRFRIPFEPVLIVLAALSTGAVRKSSEDAL